MKLQHLIVFFGILMSCNTTADVPAELYDQEEMAIIMKDIYLLEFKVRELNLHNDSSKKIFDKYQAEYFRENEIDTAKYKDSYHFYLQRPQLLEQVYAIIADSLSLQNRIQSK